jgi:nucleotide-binding universal stress UspA family protein
MRGVQRANQEDTVTTTQPAPVVAGVDGSAQSRTAAALAAWEATRENRTLRLVCGFDQPLTAGQVMLPPDVIREPMDSAATVLKDTAGILQRDHPGLRVETQVTVGNPATVLVDESRAAALVVVGSRGLGGFTGLLVGSVSTQVATHAHAPVMVARGAPPDDPHAPPVPGAGPVVVGVDGSSRSAAAIEYALDEADDRHQPLIAVYAYEAPQSTEEEAQRVAEEATTDAAARYTQVRVEHRVLDATNAAKAILDVGEEVGASLLVVGSRGRHGFSGLLLGSVSQAVLGHARRTVAVVHPHAQS